MELSHLSDNELIDYVIKHDTDPVRVRLATYMQRVPGAIIDDLEDAGMDSTFCTFMTEWGGERLPGQYIMHLEEEIKIRDDTIAELQAELEQQKARTIVDLIMELKQEIKTSEWMAQEARRERDYAEADRKLMKDKLSMWTKLNGHGV
jgi:hypothetical protein